MPDSPPSSTQPPCDPMEFDRPHDFTTKAAGPREFARATQGSRMTDGGRSKIITPKD